LNISRLRELLKPLPDSFNETELSTGLANGLLDELDDMCEVLRVMVRRADEEELRVTLERAATLQAKLGNTTPHVPASPASNKPVVRVAQTDYEAGIGDDEDDSSVNSIQSELADLRRHNVEKRRRMNEH
jgi:hypothetical protein